MRMSSVLVLAATVLVATVASPIAARAKQNCQGARVVGELSGKVEVCYLSTDSFGDSHYRITVTRVDQAGTATVGLCLPASYGPNCAYLNPLNSSFTATGCATNVFSFGMGWSGASPPFQIVAFLDVSTGYQVLGSGELGGVGRATATPCGG